MFGKKKSQIAEENRRQIEENARTVDVLISLCKNNDELYKRLLGIKEIAKYIIPSSDVDTTRLDAGIACRLDDIKAVLLRKDFEAAEKRIGTLEYELVERKSKR